MALRGPDGSRLAQMRRLALAHAALKTAVCKRVVGVGLSQDRVKLARGRRGMCPGEEPGKGNLKDVPPGGNLHFYITAEWELVSGVKESKCSQKAAPHYHQSLQPSLKSQSGLLGCLT